MNRHLSFHRRVIVLTLFMWVFTQFQMVYACELMEGETSAFCCCDKPGDMSQGCDMGGGCQNLTNLSSTDNCCEVSYEQMPSATAIAPVSHTQQVLLLDAPQPPPIPAVFILPDFSRTANVLHFTNIISPHPAGTDTYLLTGRFRI